MTMQDTESDVFTGGTDGLASRLRHLADTLAGGSTVQATELIDLLRGSADWINAQGAEMSKCVDRAEIAEGQATTPEMRRAFEGIRLVATGMAEETRWARRKGFRTYNAYVFACDLLKLLPKEAP